MSSDSVQFIRCFIAIDIPSEIKSKVSVLQDSLKRSGASIAWTKPEGIHLTLKFLGDIDQQKIPDLIGSMESAAKDAKPFVVVAEGVGCFPNPRRPRVLWVGLNGGEALISLQDRVEASVEPLGFDREQRRFHPHLTLGRVRNPFGVERVVTELERLGYSRQEFMVNEVRLMKSDLQPTGAVYTLLHSVELMG
jgi:2'-5' RNA ligase